MSINGEKHNDQEKDGRADRGDHTTPSESPHDWDGANQQETPQGDYTFTGKKQAPTNNHDDEDESPL
jgi:hypothetical protein